MTEATSGTCELSFVEMMFLLPTGKDATAEVSRLGRTLEKTKKKPARAAAGKPTQRLVDASLLGVDDSHFLWFHIDADAGPPPVIFVHAKYRRTPDKNPPKALRDAQRAGKTTATFARFVDKVAGGPTSAVAYFSVELTLKDWRRATPGPVGMPLALDGNVLELAGAEYAGKERPFGVQRLRYSEVEPGRIFMRVEYVDRFATPFDPWHTEFERCLKYARTAL